VIGSTRNLRVWAYPGAADLRLGYDGLAGLVASKLGADPLSGDCFLFTNRSRTRAKVLVWDGTGLAIYQKRLEQGRFASLRTDTGRIALTMSELSLYLEGCRLVERVKLSPEAYVPGPLTSSRRRDVADGEEKRRVGLRI
jgi:transposase